MDEQIMRKIGLIHALAGAIFGVFTAFYFNVPGLTLISVLMIGFVFSYPLYVLTRKIFDLPDKEFSVKVWICKGYFLFFVVWIIVWTLIYNYRLSTSLIT